MSTHQSLQDTYWSKRLQNPRVSVVFLIFANLYHQIRAMVRRETEAAFIVNVCFSVTGVISLALTVPSFFNSRYNSWVRFGYMLTAFRQVILLFDILDTRDKQDPDSWMLFCMVQLFTAIFALSFHFTYFNPKERGHIAFNVIYLNVILAGMFVSCRDLDNDAWLLDFLTMRALVLIAGGFVAYIISSAETAHSEHLTAMFSHMKDQEFLKLVLDQNSDAILILDGASQVCYSNPNFALLFAQALSFSIQTLPFEGSPRSQFPTEEKLARCSQLGQFLRRIVSRSDQAKSRPGSEKRPPSFFSSDPKSASFPGPAFCQLKLFKDTSDPEAEFVSLAELFGRSFIETVWKVADLEALETNRNLGSCPSQSSSQKYIRITIQDLSIDEVRRRLVQVQDVSNTVLYDKSKEKNEMLSQINATVSHELRNPLNAIVGQNTLKENLYADLQIQLKELRTNPESREQAEQKIHQILGYLKEGLRVQNASAQIMGFLVQDMLDFAQIKQDKFRTNIQPFNLRETVNNVMLIQKDKAKEQHIQLRSVFPNISEEDNSDEKGVHAGELIWKSQRRFSPIIYSDEQRLKQVLLNLQSNALKFTRKGSVTIIAEITQGDDLSPLPSALRSCDAHRERYLKVTVADTGVGIPREDQAKLFQTFGYLKSTAKHNQNGIGLGLVISKQIVTQLGGSIDFRSVPEPSLGHGTSFFFTFKLSSPEAFHEQKQQNQSTTFPKHSVNSSAFVFDWKPTLDRAPLSASSSDVPSQSSSDFIPSSRPLSTVKREGQPWRTGETNEFELQRVDSVDVSKGPQLKAGILAPEQQLSVLKMQKETPLGSPLKTKRRRRRSLQLSGDCSDPSKVQLSYSNKRCQHRRTDSSQVSAFLASLNALRSRHAQNYNKVLIVDDQGFNIKALTAILEHRFNISPDRCDYCLNGADALEKVKKDFHETRRVTSNLFSEEDQHMRPKFSYRLILMDCTMPFMDGFECTERIRNFYFFTGQLEIEDQPIISAITGHSEDKYIRRCFESGMNQVLSKPVEQDPLLSACLIAGITTSEQVKAHQQQKAKDLAALEEA